MGGDMSVQSLVIGGNEGAYSMALAQVVTGGDGRERVMVLTGPTSRCTWPLHPRIVAIAFVM